jgi:hypothetical protein
MAVFALFSFRDSENVHAVIVIPDRKKCQARLLLLFSIHVSSPGQNDILILDSRLFPKPERCSYFQTQKSENPESSFWFLNGTT